MLDRWDSFKGGIAVAYRNKKPPVKSTEAEASKTAASNLLKSHMACQMVLLLMA
ncbi:MULTISPECIES: hypothetical protein [unclassified Bacillus (in: firmicutes)]